MSYSRDEFNLLLEQYRILSEDIRSLESMSEKVLGFGVTIISASVLYGLKEGVREVHFLATPSYLGILLFISNQYHNVMWKGGHKRFIELRIEEMLEKRLLIWEALVENKRKRFTFANAMFGSFLLISSLCFFLYSLFQVKSIFGLVPSFAFSAVSIFLASALCLSVWDGSKKFQEALVSSESVYRGKLPGKA